MYNFMVKTCIRYCINVHISECILLGDELDDHENTADTINESVTPEPVCDSPQATQRSHISEEDSEVPIVEPTECKMPPIDNAKFVITVIKAPFKQQLHEPIVYPPAVETKFSDSLLPSHGTSYLSLVCTVISLIHKLAILFFLSRRPC